MDSKTIIRKYKKENNFIMLDKTCINDTRLSFKAKGIHTYIMGLPDDWKIYACELAKHSTDGEKAIRSGLKELEDLGYVTKIQVRENGKIARWDYIVYETIEDNPYIAKGVAKTTLDLDAEKVDVEKVDVGLVDILNNKELNNKELNNNLEKEEVEIVFGLYYNTFKLESKKMPHTMKLLRDNAKLFDIELWEEIFISASGDGISNKFKYVRAMIKDLVKDKIFSLEEYKKRADQKKSAINPNNSIRQIDKKYTGNNQQKVEGSKFDSNIGNHKKGASHGVNNNFMKYSEDELERILLESQEGKFI